MDRLFLDANVLFSAAYRTEAGVARLWSLPGPILFSSEYAIDEARRNLSVPEQVKRLERLLESVERAPSVSLDPNFRLEIELRDKDWPILGGAVTAETTNLITGDWRDFGPYFGTKLLGVLIQTPADYLANAG